VFFDSGANIEKYYFMEIGLNGISQLAALENGAIIS